MAIVAEKGYAATTVADLTKRAGISRTTFYELFEDKEACFLAAYDNAVDVLVRRISVAYESEERWPDRARAGLRTLLEALASDPAQARLALVDVAKIFREHIRFKRAMEKLKLDVRNKEADLAKMRDAAAKQVDRETPAEPAAIASEHGDETLVEHAEPAAAEHEPVTEQAASLDQPETLHVVDAETGDVVESDRT